MTRERLLVDCLSALCNASRGLDDLGPPAVVERDPEREAGLRSRAPLELAHLLLQPVGRPVPATDESRADAFLRKVVKLAVDGLPEDLHERGYLVRRASPVLRRERVDRQRLDAELDRRLDDRPQRARARAVPLRDLEPLPRRPAPVAVHDDRDGARDFGGLGRRSPLGRHQTSMTSDSLCFSRSSICFVWSSVSFCTRSSARCSSSAPTSPLSTRSFRCFIASRRISRTATRCSSARPRTTFTSSLRRSSVSCGIGSRMILPSFDGVRPRSDSWIAFSIERIELGSNGCTVRMRDAGTPVVASCFNCVAVP